METAINPVNAAIRLPYCLNGYKNARAIVCSQRYRLSHFCLKRNVETYPSSGTIFFLSIQSFNCFYEIFHKIRTQETKKQKKYVKNP